MSRSTQDKVLKAIESAATDNGFEVVTDFSFGNRGELRVESADSFEPVLWLTFDFQLGNFHFERVKPELPGIGRVDKNGQTIAVYYAEQFGTTATADEVIKAIRNRLATARQAILDKEFANS